MAVSLPSWPARTTIFSDGQHPLGLEVPALQLDDDVVAVDDAPAFDRDVFGRLLAQFVEGPVDVLVGDATASSSGPP